MGNGRVDMVWYRIAERYQREALSWRQDAQSGRYKESAAQRMTETARTFTRMALVAYGAAAGAGYKTLLRLVPLDEADWLELKRARDTETPIDDVDPKS